MSELPRVGHSNRVEKGQEWSNGHVTWHVLAVHDERTVVARWWATDGSASMVSLPIWMFQHGSCGKLVKDAEAS